jgi:hypothetical protein
MPDTRARTTPEHGINFRYAAQTSTGPLRGHLRRLHYDLYISTCKQEGWNEYLEEHEKPGYDANRAAALAAPCGPSSSRIPFSQEGLIDALVKFIVADDQVNYLFLLYFSLFLFYLLSLSTSSNAVNSVTSCFTCGMGLRMRISHTALK